MSEERFTKEKRLLERLKRRQLEEDVSIDAALEPEPEDEEES